MQIDLEPKNKENISQVPEDFRVLYEENPDDSGVYHVKEDLKKVAAAITGLNSSLRKSREESNKFRGATDLSALSEYGKPAEEFKGNVEKCIKEANEAAGKDTRKALDTARETLIKDFNSEKDNLIKERDSIKKALENEILNSSVNQAIASNKGVYQLLAHVVKSQIKIEHGEGGKYNLTVVDEDGNPRYENLTGQPMSIESYVKSLKAHPVYSRAFDSEAAAGSDTRKVNRSPEKVKETGIRAFEKHLKERMSGK